MFSSNKFNLKIVYLFISTLFHVCFNLFLKIMNGFWNATHNKNAEQISEYSDIKENQTCIIE